MTANLRIFVTLLLLTAGLVLAVVTPPFQSPDENDHVKRAFLFSRGVLVLETPRGLSSGGMIDTGLLAYMDAYPPRMPPLSETGGESVKLAWTGNRIFSPAPGTGYYFPLAYLPQAVALAAGERFGLTIEHSYWLARVSALVTSLMLMLAAFSLFPPSPLVLALISLPMTLFQLSSAGLDGTTTALAVLSVSVFMRIARDRGAAPAWLLLVLAGAVLTLAMCRIHAAPLLLMLPTASWFQRSWKGLLLFIPSLLIFAGWTFVAIHSTADFRVVGTQSAGAMVEHYLSHPLSFVEVLIATVTDPVHLAKYLQSFIGVLGWLDAAFSPVFYTVLLAVTLAIGFLSVSRDNLRVDWPQRLMLVLLALGSVMLLFLALLVTWNNPSTLTIEGVQGRYFLIPAIMLAYALAGGKSSWTGANYEAALALCFCLYLVSFAGTVNLLLERFYLPPSRQSAVFTYEPLDHTVGRT